MTEANVPASEPAFLVRQGHSLAIFVASLGLSLYICCLCLTLGLQEVAQTWPYLTSPSSLVIPCLSKRYVVFLVRAPSDVPFTRKASILAVYTNLSSVLPQRATVLSKDLISTLSVSSLTIRGSQ